MKLGEKVALLDITESIEMELITSEEPREAKTKQKKEKEHNCQQRLREHLLIPVCDCEEDPELQVQISPRQQIKPKTKSPVEEGNNHRPTVARIKKKIEVLPLIRVTEFELVEIKSSDPSIMTKLSPNMINRVRWRRPTPQKKGLVVKDVLCLPRGYYMAPLERQVVPRSKERAVLVAMGLTARITVDYSWSANQIENRLVMLFGGKFEKRAGQTFSFTYLQCLQGSRVLFVPDTPAQGWTGEQVLRLSGHSAVYILSDYDCPQAEGDGGNNCAEVKTWL
ncbi:uncharacterized protein [Embiotoca jacksoni]|uniref:uncharacterized protein n=1 Tax=Embiotoca jacksoni TaxID=100190 RepID=UPI003703A8D4